MIAIVVVLELIAIFAHLSMPLFQTAQLRTQAAAIAREMQQVKGAALRAHVPDGGWPADQPPGTVPAELRSYLPPGFTFAHKDYQLDWNSWELPSESLLASHGRHLAGITVIARDPLLASSVAAQLPRGELRLALDRRATLVIEQPGSLER